MSLFFAGAMVAGLLLTAAFVFVAFLIKMVCWAILLPLRLLFKLTFGLGGLVIGAVLAPVLILLVVAAVVVALVAAILSALLPLLPIVLLGLVGWAIYRSAGGASVFHDVTRS